MTTESDNVVPIESNSPHQTGTVRCWMCGHEWVGVAPVRRRLDAGLECPACHDMAGVFLLGDDEARTWLSNVAQLLDGWHCDTAWSEWDETIRAELTRAQVTFDHVSARAVPPDLSERIRGAAEEIEDLIARGADYEDTDACVDQFTEIITRHIEGKDER